MRVPTLELFNISETEFEDISYFLCLELLGEAVGKFSKGPDGGRDARYHGSTDKLNSGSTITGSFVIQAKHTDSPDQTCSNKQFLAKFKAEEIPRISRLITAKELDYYVLFTNRKTSGCADEVLYTLITTNCGIQKDRIFIYGKETIEALLLKYPQILKSMSIFTEPLRFDGEDLKNLIQIIAREKQIINEIVTITEDKFKYIDKEEKNKKNRLSQLYWEQIKSSSLPYFSRIEDFMNNPINEDFATLYDDITSELQNKILINRDNFGEFDEIFENIYDHIMTVYSSELKGKKRLVWTLLHYMYFMCDIGVK